MTWTALDEPSRIRFVDRQGTQLRTKLRVAFPLIAGLFFFFGFFDYVLSSEIFERNMWLRAASITSFVALFFLIDRAKLASRVYAIFYLSVGLGTFFIAKLRTELGHDEAIAVGSLLLLSSIVAALSPGFFSAARAFVLMLVTVFLTSMFSNAPQDFLIVVNAFMLAAAATGIVLANINERLMLRAFSLELELERLATRDTLTGARNRGAFMQAVQEEIARADRYPRAVALLMIDIDHFKRVNDTYGHPAGDAVIQRLASTCQRELRSADVLGRVGGEEFAVLLPETDAATAQNVAERLRAAIAAQTVQHNGHDITFTMSLGAAERRSGETMKSLLFRADEALYAAKHAGRNRVCLAGE